MPTELEELVEFLHHGNTQIRQIAAENLVGYSTAQPALFKTGQLTPIKDLKLLIKDYTAIAKNALTMLINLSDDPDVLASLAKDDAFLESLLFRITNAKEPNANEMCMLLANLAKHPSLSRILSLTRPLPKSKGLSTSQNAMDQLLDCFVKGAGGSFNKDADYDYLSYFFADMAKYPEARTYFTTPRPEPLLAPTTAAAAPPASSTKTETAAENSSTEDVIPLTKLTVFTEHASIIRRRGVASTLKNVCFTIDAHPALLSTTGANILPYLLLPLMGAEEYSASDTESLLEDLQLLPPDKEREADPDIVRTHLESLLLLGTTREGRQVLRDVNVYAVVRECHAAVEDEAVREACDRIVQVLKRGEEGEDEGEEQRMREIARGLEGEADRGADPQEVEEDEDEDEDDMLVEV